MPENDSPGLTREQLKAEMPEAIKAPKTDRDPATGASSDGQFTMQISAEEEGDDG